MAAITPHEVGASKNGYKTKVIEAYEPQLNEWLLNNYGFDRSGTAWTPKIIPKGDVKWDYSEAKILAEHYRSAGWDVEAKWDQRDGSWLTFKA